MYYPNAINSLGSQSTASPSSQSIQAPQMNEQQQQAAALVAAAVANELIENHAQSLNLNTLNQVVAAKLITTSASRLATNATPDLYPKKSLNGTGGVAAVKTHKASPLALSPAAALYGTNTVRKPIDTPYG